MARLPKPGGDAGQWGEILNEFLSQSISADGSLNISSVGAPQLKPGAVTSTAIANGAVTAAKVADGAIGENQLADDSVSAAKLQDAGQANGPVVLDGDALMPVGAIPMQAVADSDELKATTQQIVEDVVPDALAASEYLPEEYAANRSWTDDYVRSVFASPVWQDTPTVVVSNATFDTALSSPVEYRPAIVGTGSGTASWDGASDTNFRYWPGTFETGNGANGDLALYGGIKPGGVAQGARWPVVAEFMTTSANTIIEIGGYSRGQAFVWFEINGRLFQTSPMQIRANAGAHRTTLTFPVAAARRIRILADGSFGIRAVRVPTGETISKPTAPSRVLAVIGDSWVNGAGSSVQGEIGAGIFETFAFRLLRMMGGPRAHLLLAGIGGTGLTAGSGGGSNYATRAAAVLAANPHTVVIYCSQNDGNSNQGSALTSLLSTLSSVPRIIVLPPLWGSPVQVASVKAATAAAGREYLDMSDFINGTGYIAAPTGDGNRDLFMFSSTDLHMNIPGHQAAGAAAFRKLIAQTIGG